MCFFRSLAALLGLVLALAALAIAAVTGDSRWDAAGSIAIGVVLVTVAVILARETKSLLIGEAPSKSYEPEIARIVGEEIPEGRVLRFIAQQCRAILLHMQCPEAFRFLLQTFGRPGRPQHGGVVLADGLPTVVGRHPSLMDEPDVVAEIGRAHV